MESGNRTRGRPERQRPQSKPGHRPADRTDRGPLSEDSQRPWLRHGGTGEERRKRRRPKAAHAAGPVPGTQCRVLQTGRRRSDERDLCQLRELLQPLGCVRTTEIRAGRRYAPKSRQNVLRRLRPLSANGVQYDAKDGTRTSVPPEENDQTGCQPRYAPPRPLRQAAPGAARTQEPPPQTRRSQKADGNAHRQT